MTLYVVAIIRIYGHGETVQARRQSAVRLPKEFRFEGNEVFIEKRGNEVVLKAVGRARLKGLSSFVKYMRENCPSGNDFPDIERPLEQERDLDLDK